MTCRSADGWLAEKARTTSPLLQVELFEQGQEWVEKLQALKRKMAELHGRLSDELKAVDAQWISTAAVSRREMMPTLENLYRMFGYFNRWNNQIQERLVQLSL